MHIANIMFAEHLVTQGAKSSLAMLLILFVRNFPAVSVPKRSLDGSASVLLCATILRAVLAHFGSKSVAIKCSFVNRHLQRSSFSIDFSVQRYWPHHKLGTRWKKSGQKILISYQRMPNDIYHAVLLNFSGHVMCFFYSFLFPKYNWCITCTILVHHLTDSILLHQYQYFARLTNYSDNSTRHQEDRTNWLTFWLTSFQIL